ncbi:hypothetical protein BBF96_12625 [Anoxybacter fermentans]|uniref:Phosphatidic acid phosphatase type 2/haloperoxidase domain-containing protein n=1 Tax=Anoxybacter fermentans TaxID=1323375 RepID=A0A3Q9HS60_9FIRM|nr:phosphatase PAP2 family protein [Anoxybacter fermentans]AZR74165.1 hypothetical protein BBF96_12625 [Anoxybacter fermentans]
MSKRNVVKNLWSRYNHLLILLYYGVIGLLYHTFNKYIVPKYYVHSFLDDYIPFIKVFVIPYLFWYLYIAIAVTYFGLTSREDFIKLMLFMFGGMTICFFIYFILPNGQKLRPVITEQDFLSRLIKGIYSIDRPTNVSPSMHVLDAIAVHLAVIKSKKLQNRKWIHYISLVCAILISLSTVFIKQHSVEDVIYAMLLSYALYRVIYKPQRNRKPYFEKESVYTSG